MARTPVYGHPPSPTLSCLRLSQSADNTMCPHSLFGHPVSVHTVFADLRKVMPAAGHGIPVTPKRERVYW